MYLCVDISPLICVCVDLATLAAEAFVSLANDMASFNVSFKV